MQEPQQNLDARKASEDTDNAALDESAAAPFEAAGGCERGHQERARDEAQAGLEALTTERDSPAQKNGATGGAGGHGSGTCLKNVPSNRCGLAGGREPRVETMDAPAKLGVAASARRTRGAEHQDQCTRRAGPAAGNRTGAGSLR